MPQLHRLRLRQKRVSAQLFALYVLRWMRSRRGTWRKKKQKVVSELMKKHSSKRNRFWLPILVLALGVTLALGGCARTGPASSGGSVPSGQSTSGSGQTGTGQTGSGNASSDINALQQLDQQTQNDVNTLNNDQNNANQNPGNDQETQP
jgi:hypothetical protein